MPLLAKATELSVEYVPEALGFQVSPPSVVLRIVPSPPTVHPVVRSSAKVVDLSSAEKPEVWGVQSSPPLVVLRIVPVCPTAHPMLRLLGKLKK